MTDSDQLEASATGEPGSPDSGGASANPAVSRCTRAYQRAYRGQKAATGSDYKGECAGNQAFLRAMPPLSGYENIRDFIACLAYASMADVLRLKEANNLLAVAKVALAALRQQPKPPEPPGPPGPPAA